MEEGDVCASVRDGTSWRQRFHGKARFTAEDAEVAKEETPPRAAVPHGNWMSGDTSRRRRLAQSPEKQQR